MLAAISQQQRRAHTERGNSWGMCASFPAVVHDNAQEGAMASPSRCAVISSLVKLGGAVKSPVLFTRIPDRRARFSSRACRRSRVRGSLRFASGTNSYGARLQPRSILSATCSNRSRAHTCPMKPSYQLRAYRDFLRHFGVLSFVPSVKSPCTEGMPSRWQSLPSQAAR